jgi:hypothetical protein
LRATERRDGGEDNDVKCDLVLPLDIATPIADDGVMMAGALPNGDRDNNDLARLENVCLD